MKYGSRMVYVKDLVLDPLNPRFIIPPKATQSDIISYLLEYENVQDLAKDINNFGGFMAGERIIVCEENGKLVVLEGNRRICACKLLLDRTLVPAKYNKFPIIEDSTKDNITRINVDVMSNRETAQSTLYNRHLGGVKPWSTISKQKFYVNAFEQGKSITEIAKITTSTEGAVKKGIREYNLMLLALNLDKWSDEERQYSLNLQKIKVAPYLRVFDVKSKKYKITGSKILHLDFDEESLRPYSMLETSILEHAIYLIANAAFFNKEFNTRNTIDDVPGLFDFLITHGILPMETENNDTSKSTLYVPDNSEIAVTVETPQTIDTVREDTNDAEEQNNITTSKPQDPAKLDSSNKSNWNNGKDQSPKAPSFFHALTWNGLNPSNPDHIGLINIADEIKRLSMNNLFGRYPIGTAMLLRALFEQSLKYYTKQIGEWDNLLSHSNKKPGFDPMMKDIVSYYRSSNNHIRFFKDRTIQSAFACATDTSTLNFFDTNIHNTHIIKATKIELENMASKGLFALINYILNFK